MAELNDPVLSFLSDVRERGSADIHRATVPILGQRHATSGDTVIGGTGVLFACDDASFLVGAAHVLDLKATHNVPLYIPTDEGTASDIGGELAIPRDLERVDVGVLRLDDATAGRLRDLGARFVRAAETFDVDPMRPPAGGYVVYGYPESELHPSKLSGEAVPSPRYLSCVRYNGSTELFPSWYDRRIHHLLGLDRANVRDQHSGEIVSFPHPKGMSGCGVWWAYHPQDSVEGWRPEHIKLAAVQSSYFKDPGVLLTVTFATVKSMIKERWPELGPALRVLSPNPRRRYL